MTCFPKVELVACTALCMDGLIGYLRRSGNEEFIDSVRAAKAAGMHDAEILISTMAKLCYKSLTLGHNTNLTRVRSIKDNIQSAIMSGHGSVLEHASMSFIAYDCSRVFTHELVRHRAGTAYSQNSGRYIPVKALEIVNDPLLDPVQDEIDDLLKQIEFVYGVAVERLGLNDPGIGFDQKKKITSALRRIIPSGAPNEIGFTVNMRALRFIIEKRTCRHAEWEIRVIFERVFNIAKQVVPTLVADANCEMVDGIAEITFNGRT